MAAILKWFVWLYGHCIGMRVARGNGDLWTGVTVILPSRLMSASKQATTWLAWVNPAEYWGIYFLFNYILTLKIVIFYGLTILRWMTVVSVKKRYIRDRTATCYLQILVKKLADVSWWGPHGRACVGSVQKVGPCVNLQLIPRKLVVMIQNNTYFVACNNNNNNNLVHPSN
jgi:hypothetical protein